MVNHEETAAPSHNVTPARRIACDRRSALGVTRALRRLRFSCIRS